MSSDNETDFSEENLDSEVRMKSITVHYIHHYAAPAYLSTSEDAQQSKRECL